ncbi:MAG: hypothetical protein KJ077_45375 [Anaerolineae bacterium]|nr:hypothetical protein [Anaerolineae bacterium]
MSITIEELNQKQAKTDKILKTLREVLTTMLDAYEVEYDEVKITGIEVTPPKDGHGDKPQRPKICLLYDAQGRPYWGPCPKK